MNILIIEDDVFLAEKIGAVFQSKVISNRVKIVHSFVWFLDEFSLISSYDIVLTDLKLCDSRGGFCGYKIIRAIREKKLKMPIVVISSFSDIERLRLAFGYGASDYIIKPIRLKELELRILNWFRNYYLSNNPSDGRMHYYKDLRYDIDKNEFYFKNSPLPLTRNNKYLLSLFFTHPGKLLKESFLIEKIWGDVCLNMNRNLRVNILRLKKSLEPFGIDLWIRNSRGEGYMFSDK